MNAIVLHIGGNTQREQVEKKDAQFMHDEEDETIPNAEWTMKKKTRRSKYAAVIDRGVVSHCPSKYYMG